MLDGPHDELRRDAMDALCTMAVVLGQDFNMFVPTIRKVCTVAGQVVVMSCVCVSVGEIKQAGRVLGQDFNMFVPTIRKVCIVAGHEVERSCVCISVGKVKQAGGVLGQDSNMFVPTIRKVRAGGAINLRHLFPPITECSREQAGLWKHRHSRRMGVGGVGRVAG